MLWHVPAHHSSFYSQCLRNNRVLVSLSAYSGTWVYSFLKDTFTKCFLGMAVPEQSNNPNHCHCHFQTSRPQSLLPQHSLLSKMIYWLAHFLTFHPKKSIFTLLSTPLQELKARLGISKPCYLNVCIKYKWHARVKHLLCINPSDATYTPNLIDSTPFGNFKRVLPRIFSSITWVSEVKWLA